MQEGFRGSRDPNIGQSAGPPGMGPEPILSHEPGGAIVRELVHPAWEIFNETYSALPEDSWFDPNVNPQRPIQFELGAFNVPQDMHYWLFDYQFQILRPSGVDAGDSFPALEGQFSGSLGFDLTFSGRRMSHLLFQLDPVPVQLQRQTFDPLPGQRAQRDQFNRSAAQSFAANSPAGTSLLPVTNQRYGPRNAPFTLIANQNTRVALSVVIFNPIPSPITAITGSSRGYLIHGQVSSALINRLRPR
jgi:hypothetical protein